ncbi:hypothetical protein WI61_36015 [Burkholderia cepacia]|nr:hypothetical protein WI49_31100 [Burkholderia cepacia]KVA67064.1 hypothetical protein WI48_03645 [Burkholderia cepacia]KVA80124.1 hypothetical protein WI52_22880 [Burkholderia cepacia]KVA92255.1 hypothetical protein WI50_05575 [Burkholderia cepacia]KVA96327.1 hypothetical protein WI51_36180 [Burkholderia cepacia]
MHFKILYTEEQSIVNSKTTSQNIDIGWNEMRTVTIPAGATWQLQYNRFDGKQMQVAGVYGDAFVKVSQTANRVTVSTAPFSDLDESIYNSALQAGVQQAPKALSANNPK